ncbi:HAD family hydrolase [Candidatus Woesearchaeota archaeon]|nr:HAD family hydrolase [Candidatus Woesearchaeota archaeon]
MIKGVIFDWNGTLSDDIPRVFSVAMKTSERLGGRVLSLAEYRRLVRNPYMPFYRDLGCTASKKETNRWYQYYLNRSKIPVRLFPDAVKLLKFLKSHGIIVGIVSSHPGYALRAEAKTYGISRYLDFMKGDAHAKRYHIAMFLRLYKLKPKEVVFIGDMANDIEEGRKCGVITAAYLRGVDSKSKLVPQKPDIILPTLLSLKKHVSKQEKNMR